MKLIKFTPEKADVPWSGEYRVAQVNPRIRMVNLHELELEDCSGSLKVLYLAPMDEFGQPCPPWEGSVVRVTVTLTQALHGGWYNRVDKLEQIDEYSTLQLLPHRLCPVPGLLYRLYEVVNREITNPALRRFLERVFADQKRTRAFVSKPASVDCHHVEPGGLLKHSLQIVHGLDMLTWGHQNGVSRQCLLVSALLHDLGKVARDVLGMLPFQAREHASLNKLLLEKELSLLKEEDLEAWLLLHYMFSAIEGITDGNRVPGVGLLLALDRFSAAEDASRRAFESLPRYRQIASLKPSNGGPSRSFYRPRSEALQLGERCAGAVM